MRVVFVGAHLGFPMDRTPLGGGAMVALRLARQWAKDGRDVVLLGAGPVAPTGGLPYERLPGGDEASDRLVSLSELEYASFCRRFEKATTSWILSRMEQYPPASTVVLVNDISEGPNLAALTGAGYCVASIWHVDVVDYFNKLYLRRLVSPERLTRLFEACRSLPVPDVLRLVFEKQRQTVARSGRLIYPSGAMAQTVERCYGGVLVPAAELRARARVIPWGVFDEKTDEEAARRQAQALRRHFAIGPETTTVLTVSRISPEKGLHLLLKAFAELEGRGAVRGDVCALICGEPAFMMGEKYLARVRRAARELSRVRVFFPGYLSAQDKRAYYQLADLFVSPSVHESYGLNIAEALGAGLPVLASDHYGVAELIKPSYGRSVSYSTDPMSALAGGLNDLLLSKDKLKAMGQEALKAAAAMRFDKAADDVFKACEELLKPVHSMP